jgi:hypothetical protein
LAALVPGRFCKFHKLKNPKNIKNSISSEARENQQNLGILRIVEIPPFVQDFCQEFTTTKKPTCLVKHSPLEKNEVLVNIDVPM